MPPHAPLIWVLIDDRPGTASQALGVAEALGLPFVEKRIGYTSLAKLPNIVRGSSLVGVSASTTAQLAPAFAAGAPDAMPDVVIAAGRRAAPVARWIKKVAHERAGKKVLLAHIMNPGRAGAADFDLIAIPNHDCDIPDPDLDEGDAREVSQSSASQSCVLRITGAPHRFSPQRLQAEAAAWAGKLGHLPRPTIAVLVGGATKSRGFPASVAAALGAHVSAMARAAGGAVLLSTSRRTGPEAEAALLAAIPEPRHIYMWGAQGPADAANPYAAYLALADAVVVTGDSVSMCSEACASTVPVHIFAPPGLVTPKHARLHAELYAAGLAQPFDGRFAPGSHAPLNAANAVAARIAELIAAQSR